MASDVHGGGMQPSAVLPYVVLLLSSRLRAHIAYRVEGVEKKRQPVSNRKRRERKEENAATTTPWGCHERESTTANTIIALPQEMGIGKDREVQTLLADPWRKLVLICLRHGALLADHSAKVPITIQTVVGKGTLRVGDRTFALAPGVLVAVDAHEEHNVRAEPEIAMLVTFFRQAGETTEETTAKFDEN